MNKVEEVIKNVAYAIEKQDKRAKKRIHELSLLFPKERAKAFNDFWVMSIKLTKMRAEIHELALKWFLTEIKERSYEFKELGRVGRGMQAIACVNSLELALSCLGRVLESLSVEEG